MIRACTSHYSYEQYVEQFKTHTANVNENPNSDPSLQCTSTSWSIWPTLGIRIVAIVILTGS